MCLKLVRKDHAIPLSDVLPVLENMGLRVIHEQPYEFVTARAGRFWMHDFRVQPIEAMALAIEQVRDAFQEAFARVWRGEVENDGFNQLVLHGLDWRQILVLRAYCKYLLQVGIPFSQAYMEQTLAHNPAPRAPGGRAVRGQVRSRRRRATARRGSPSSRRGFAPASMPWPTSTRTGSSGATCA